MNKKFIIGIVLFTVLILGGGIIYSNSAPSKATIEKTQGSKIRTFEQSYDFKDIKYDGGNVKHPFKIENTGTKDLTIANMATSCMCTKVYLKTKQTESPKFGMKGHAAESRWTGSLRAEEEAEVVVEFDPTAHGPSGVGSISRIVSFDTNDPDKPYVEFSISGNVVK